MLGQSPLLLLCMFTKGFSKTPNGVVVLQTEFELRQRPEESLNDLDSVIDHMHGFFLVFDKPAWLGHFR